jgi:hypothetical protein
MILRRWQLRLDAEQLFPLVGTSSRAERRGTSRNAIVSSPLISRADQSAAIPLRSTTRSLRLVPSFRLHE